jgi:hypothetical protein
MANIWEKAISILAGNLNSGLSYLIITVLITGSLMDRQILLGYHQGESNVKAFHNLVGLSKDY